MAEQHEGPIDTGMLDEDDVDMAYALPPRRPRFIPDAAPEHYARDGARDHENASTSPRWRHHQPRE